MKQTNNAIKFLMAQYRAIFKSAYVKGLATAVVLTSALASGQAQAADYGTIDSLNTDNGSKLTIKSGDNIKIASSGSATISNDIEISDFTPQPSDVGGIFASGDHFFITSANDFIYTVKDQSKPFYFGSSTNDKKLEATFNNVTIKNGLFLIEASTSADANATSAFLTAKDTVTIDNAHVVLRNTSGSSAGSNAVLRGDTINVTGKNAVVDIGNTTIDLAAANAASGGRAQLGWRPEVDSNGNEVYAGSVISVTNGATINLIGGTDSGSTADNYIDTLSYIRGKSLTVDNSNINVKGHGAQIEVFDAAFNNSNLTVNKGAMLSVTPKEATVLTAPATEYGDNITGTAKVNGGIVKVEGNLAVPYGGTLEISDSTVLTAGNTDVNMYDLDPSAKEYNRRDGVIWVTVSDPNSNTNKDTATSTLKLSSTKLAEFLKAGDEIKDTATKTTFKDKAGALILDRGGRLELSDKDQVEISQFHFNLTYNEKGAGIIRIDDTPASSALNRATIYADKMSIGQSLYDPNDKSNSYAKNFSKNAKFEANVLTLGSEKGTLLDNTKWTGFDSENSDGLGISEAVAFDEIHFVDGTSDTFHLKDDVKLQRDFYTKDASGDYTTTANKVGTIHGDNISIEGDKILNIAGGSWENVDNQTLTIVDGPAGGALFVQAEATKTANALEGKDEFGSWNYYKSGNPTSLTWHGNFVFAGQANKDDGIVVVRGAKGADATLDLRDAKITWGNGALVADGQQEVQTSATDPSLWAGEGIIMITGNQLSDYLTDTSVKTQIELQNNGVLFVDGNVTGSINFNKFTSTAASAGDIYFSGAGTLVSTGELSLVTGVDLTPNDGTDNPVTDSLKLGSGTIEAVGIDITNKNIAADDKGTAEDKVTVAQGTLEVAQRLSSDNANIVFGDNGSSGALVLDADTATDAGYVSSNLMFTNGSKLTAENGQWTVNGNIDINSGSLTVGAGSDEFERYGTAATLKAKNLNIVANANSNEDLKVYGGSAAEFETMQATNGADITVNGTLTIAGRADISDAADSEDHDAVQAAKDTAGIDLTDAKITVNGGKLVLGDTAATTLVTFTAGSDNTSGSVTVNDVLADAIIELNNNAEFKLDFSKESAAQISTTGLNAAQARDLKANLVDSLNGGSYINVGQLALDIKYDDKTMTSTWNDVKDFVQVESDVTNDAIKQLLITGITSADNVSGHFGAMQLDAVGNNSLRVDGNLGLHNARDGYFVFTEQNGTKKVAGVSLTSTYSTLQLDGAGKIGSITGSDVDGDTEVTFSAGDEKTLNPGVTEVMGDIKNVGNVYVANDVNVSGAMTAGTVELTHNMNVSGDSFVNELGSWQESALTTKNLTVANYGIVAGSVKVSEKLTLGAGSTRNAANLHIAGGEVVTNELVLNNGSAVYAGWEADESDDVDTEYFVENQSYSGRFEAQVADLNGGALIADPAPTNTASLISVTRFAGGDSETRNAGEVDGTIFAGQNSAIGIGTTSLAQLEEVVSKYQSNGSMSTYGAILALDGRITLNKDNGLVMTARSIKDFKEYVAQNANTSLGALNKYNAFANSAYFGKDTALLVSAEAMNASQKDNGALVTFNTNDAKLIADGGEILIDGDLRAATYTVFTDSNGSVDVVDIKGQTSGAAINVKTENGFLVGAITDETGGKVTLGLNKDSRAIMGGASDPVYETLVAYVNGYNGKKNVAADGTDKTDYLYDGYKEAENTKPDGTTEVVTTKEKNYTYSNDFLQAVISNGNGQDAETAARLGVFGGSVQAAISAGNTSADAIAGRFGMGAQAAGMTFADNGQGAGLWVAPVYRNADSDSFDAEGVEYGVDMNLYGVALGGDYTLSNGLRVGAMFNIGSGDADGQGAGSLATNDFDYYGFAAFAGYTMGQFSVVGDISYTTVDNEVTANTSVDKIGAKFDSTNLSVGVTGQYTLNFNGVDVTPHAGMRLSMIDMDDYTVDGENEIANYSADSMTVFSIPVGVTFAKEFEGESWTVKPSFDLTLTGQFGDDKAEGTVEWKGVSNLSTAVSSEVFDNFTYGATAGVAAKTGNFSLGLGLNYTGSSNVSEFGVNANARFVF